MPHVIVEGSVNAETFNVFLDNLSEIVGQEFDCVVVLDNTPIHCNCAMGYDNHQIKKLPPYSPMFNAIEHAFSTLKAAIKRQLTIRMDEVLDRQTAANHNLPLTRYRADILKQIITGVIEGETVTQVMCHNWHNRVKAYLPRALQREDIVMQTEQPMSYVKY